MIRSRGTRDEGFAGTYRLGEAHEDEEGVEVIRPRDEVHNRDRKGQDDLCVRRRYNGNNHSQLMPRSGTLMLTTGDVTTVDAPRVA